MKIKTKNWTYFVIRLWLWVRALGFSVLKLLEGEVLVLVGATSSKLLIRSAASIHHLSEPFSLSGGGQGRLGFGLALGAELRSGVAQSCNQCPPADGLGALLRCPFLLLRNERMTRCCRDLLDLWGLKLFGWWIHILKNDMKKQLINSHTRNETIIKLGWT